MEGKIGKFTNLINHRSMTWGQFNDSLSYMCLAGFVVTFWPLTQEVASFNNFFYKNLFPEFIESNDNIWGKLKKLAYWRTVSKNHKFHQKYFEKYFNFIREVLLHSVP